MADVNISKYSTQVVREGSKPAAPGFVVSEGQDPVNPPGTNNYVPYTGATANVELGEFGLETGFVNLDTTPTNIPTEQGAIYWDDSKSTAALIMNGTLQHIGQDVFYYVKNSTGSSIPKGTAVRFNGTDGASGHLLIAPFLADGTYPSSYFMGVTAETIANGSFGQVMHFGELSGINTSGYTAGALLYASTTVAGGFQTTAPVAPNNIVLIAAAVNSKNNGEIVVRPTYGSNINQDEGVKITSPTTGDLLQLQAGGLWENKTVAQVIGSAYVPSTRTITINGTTQDLSANRTWNVGTVTSVGLSSATSGVTIGSTPVTGSGTITIAIATASGSQNGLLSSTDWTTFNNKQNALTLTTTGTSGAATLVGSTLNIPQYQAAGTYVTAVTASSPLSSSGGTTPNITIQQASGSQNGFLSSTDWTTFNNKQNALTNPVTGTGTTNYLPKFTGTSTIGNSNLINDASGNLGLGVTPSAWISAYRAFNIGLRGFVYSRTDSQETAIGTNWYRDSNGSFLYTSNGFASYQAQQDSVHYWFNAPSGTAGNTISFTQAMTLTSGGNLLVGTTSDNGARLQVSGTAQISGTPPSTNGGLLNIRDSVTATNVTSFAGVFFNSSPGNDYSIGKLTENGSGFLQIRNANSGTELLRINSTGAATFSSSVTAGGTISSNITKSGVGVENVNFLQLRLFGTNAIGDSLDIRYLNNNGNNIANISAILGGDNVAYGSLAFSTRNYFTDSMVEVMRINNRGNVGIGTSSPSARLHVGESGAAAQLWLQRTDGYNPVKLIGGTLSDGNGFKITMNTTDAFAITSGGNVGIGTSSPSFKLDVNGKIYSSTEVQGGSALMNLTGGYATFGSNSSSVGIRVGRDAFFNDIIINPSGNVAIGTTTDAGYKLDVNGTGRFSGALNITTSSSTALDIVGSASSTFIGLRDSSGSYVYLGSDDGDYLIQTPTSGYSTKFIVKNSGNVGIGTSSPDRKLGLLVSPSTTGDDGINLSNGSSVFIFTRTGSAYTYRGVPANAGMIYSNSNIAFLSDGTNTSFHNGNGESMRITSGGNVLIGTTTDVGAKLHVNGAVRTGAPSGGSAVDWRLGTARAGTVTTNATVRVEIDGVLVDLVARYV
jgi:hypothetical protein